MRFLRRAFAAVMLVTFAAAAAAQTLEITSDADVPITTSQTVNVGEHVRLKLRVVPATPFTNPQWIVTGNAVRDWMTKDGDVLTLGIGDFLAPAIHVVWRDVTVPGSPNVVHASVLAGASLLTATASFNVVRDDKPEKFYSDDLLMENHNNWHSVHMFSQAATRRGDLFLTWHRSQLEYFNRWRTYFGYPSTVNWNPATAWSPAVVPRGQQHPSTTVAPAAAFSQRHDLITIDLSGQALAHTTEGEFDLVTAAKARGRRASFTSAGTVLKMETVTGVICGTPCSDPNLAASGTVVLPTWWTAAGGAGSDPWYAAGCPVSGGATTCTASTKKKLADYTMRELGESIESGRYRNDYRVNYHALAHIAASEDMANPVSSMRDPIFWSWHSHLDGILSQWQAVKGAEATSPLSIYTKPSFNTGFTSVRIAFSVQVIEEFVLPGNVTVNGSPATAVTNVSTTPGQTYIFEFSGFTVPPAGPVRLVVRRDLKNTIRTNVANPRPYPTLLASTFGQVLTPSVNNYDYTKP